MFLQKQKIKIFILLFSIAFLAILPNLSEARGLVPCGGYADDSGSVREPDCNVAYTFIMVARVTNWLIASAGLYAVYQLINNGFWLVASFGKEESITKRKTALSNAIVGFVMVLMAFTFVNTAINYILASQKSGFTVDLTRPLCYLNPNDAECTKPK